VDYNKLCKILQEIEIPDHLTCLVRYLYAGQETTIRTGNGMVWGGRREEGSGWGTHVYLWWIHFDICQN